MSAVCDVTTLKPDDVVFYSGFVDGKATIEKGVVKAENFYKDGVNVYGEGWKQYVGKWFICKVERAGKIIFTDGTIEAAEAVEVAVVTKGVKSIESTAEFE